LDLLKIAILVAAFLLLIYLGRLLSAHAESRPYGGPGPFQSELTASPTLTATETTKTSALTGAEFGFPVPIPPVKRDQQGKFNRPYFLNYHFSKTDLKTGPPDATNFYDDFFLQAQDPETQYIWNYKYLVATPSGLQKLMSDERYASLYFDDPVIVVSRWDLPLILSTVVEEIMKSYGKTEFEENNQRVPE
jgi:hypothetical protein